MFSPCKIKDVTGREGGVVWVGPYLRIVCIEGCQGEQCLTYYNRVRLVHVYMCMLPSSCLRGVQWSKGLRNEMQCREPSNFNKVQTNCRQLLISLFSLSLAPSLPTRLHTPHTQIHVHAYMFTCAHTHSHVHTRTHTYRVLTELSGKLLMTTMSYM